MFVVFFFKNTETTEIYTYVHTLALTDALPIGVDSLKAKGAVFVEELDEVPDGAPVVFSAHGVPKSVPADAEARGLDYLDATCPLVSKVHRQAERLVASGRHIVFIGHRGHPEVIGTFGQVPPGSMTLVETVADPEEIGRESCRDRVFQYVWFSFVAVLLQ